MFLDIDSSDYYERVSELNRFAVKCIDNNDMVSLKKLKEDYNFKPSSATFNYSIESNNINIINACLSIYGNPNHIYQDAWTIALRKQNIDTIQLLLSKIPRHTIYCHLDAYMLINIVKTRNIDIILLLMPYFGNVNYRILTIDIDMMIKLALRMNCIKSFIDNLECKDIIYKYYQLFINTQISEDVQSNVLEKFI
jgi:hypothetical protein